MIATHTSGLPASQDNQIKIAPREDDIETQTISTMQAGNNMLMLHQVPEAQTTWQSVISKGGNESQ